MNGMGYPVAVPAGSLLFISGQGGTAETSTIRATQQKVQPGLYQVSTIETDCAGALTRPGFACSQTIDQT
jgi:hypothetical protein